MDDVVIPVAVIDGEVVVEGVAQLLALPLSLYPRREITERFHPHDGHRTRLVLDELHGELTG